LHLSANIEDIGDGTDVRDAYAGLAE